MKKIEYLADHTNDTKYSSPETMLTQILEEYQSGDRKAQKVLIITLDDNEECYHTNFIQNGLKCSEMIALMEYIKHDLLNIMKG